MIEIGKEIAIGISGIAAVLLIITVFALMRAADHEDRHNGSK